MSTETFITIPIVAWMPTNPSAAVTAFLNRPAFDATAETKAREMLADIQTNGDETVARFIRQLDGADLTPDQFAVPKAELNTARGQVDADFVAAAQEAHKRILYFARTSLKRIGACPRPRAARLANSLRPWSASAYIFPVARRPWYPRH